MNKYLLIFKTYWSQIFLFFLCIVYFLYFSYFTLQRFYNMYPMRYDLGNMVQTVWNTTQGNIFVMTHPETGQNVSRFAIHGDFFLVLLAPIYKIFPTPETLLIIQSLLIGLSGIPLYLISIKLLNKRWVSLLIVLVYFLNPSLQSSNIYEFHAVTCIPLFIFSSFYFLLLKKWVWFFIFFFLAASTKEQVSLIYFWFGLYIIFKQKNLKIGLLTIIFSLFWFVFMVWYIIPHFREGLSHFGIKFFGELGESPSSIIKGFISNPMLIWNTITSPERILYLKQVFLPLGYLPFLSPFILFPMSELLINLISNYSPMQTINYQYTAVITPLLLISLIYFYKLFLSKNLKLTIFFSIYLLFFSLLGSYFYGPLFFAKNRNNDAFKHKFRQVIDYKYLNTLIPPKASLSVTNNLGAHFAHHQFLYAFPFKYNQAQYTLIMLEDSFETIKSDKIKIYIEKLDKNPNYQLIFTDKYIFLYQKL